MSPLMPYGIDQAAKNAIGMCDLITNSKFLWSALSFLEAGLIEITCDSNWSLCVGGTKVTSQRRVLN